MSFKTLEAHPDYTHSSDILKLLQRVVETSEELPTQLWITGVSNVTGFGGGGQADIFKCHYRGMDVGARVI